MLWVTIFMSVIEDMKCICRCRIVCPYVACVLTVSYCYCQPACPTYDLLHVLHCMSSLYIPLQLVLFCGILSCSQLYMVLLVRNVIFILVCLNRLVTLCMSRLWYVNVTHIFFGVFVEVLSVYCVWLFFSLSCGWFIIEKHCSLLW
jgi:hypothetical protein